MGELRDAKSFDDVLSNSAVGSKLTRHGDNQFHTIFPAPKEHKPARVVEPVITGQSKFDEIRALQKELPDLEKFPVIKEFIESLNGLEPVEKLNLINQFSNDYIKYEDQDEVVRNYDRLSTDAEKIMKGRRGDCDDYAALKTALCRYAGFDAKDLMFLDARASYECSMDNPGQKPGTGHAILFVQCGGKVYLMDSNMNNAQILQQNEAGQLSALDVDGKDITGVTFQSIHRAFLAGGGAGYWINSDYSQDYKKALDPTAPSALIFAR